MIRSNLANEEKSDFNFIKEEGHIAMVWSAIEKNVPVYFERMINAKSADGSANAKAVLTEIFNSGVSHYEKVSAKYRSFFSDQRLQEFEDEDDPKQFRSKLATDVPIIHKALHSKYAAMKEWQQRFNWSKPSEIYAIFINLVSFMEEYLEKPELEKFGSFDSLDDLDELTKFSVDEDYNVPGVIGAGIQSSVMYFLNQQHFLCANKNTLYGLYFLSDCETFGLHSRSNEFVMINDSKIKGDEKIKNNLPIDQNYWYPYDLFILYTLRIYRLIKQLCSEYGFTLDDKNRFVHVNTFMSQIWDMKIEHINTMTGGDQEREEAR